MSIDNHALGKRIKIHRKRRGISQMKFSEMIDKSPTFVSYIENGNKNMSLDTFVDVVNALGLTPNDLLKDSIHTATFSNIPAFLEDIGECSEEEKRLILEVIQAVRQLFPQEEKVDR